MAPDLTSPPLAARMAATLDRISSRRLLINIVTGGDLAENKGDGINLPHSERYEITDEFLGIYRALLRGETVEDSGKHFQISDGRLIYPPLYFGGSSDEGFKLGTKHIDKYLTWGEPPAQVAERIATMRRHAEAEVSFGICLHGYR